MKQRTQCLNTHLTLDVVLLQGICSQSFIQVMDSFSSIKELPLPVRQTIWAILLLLQLKEECQGISHCNFYGKMKLLYVIFLLLFVKAISFYSYIHSPKLCFVGISVTVYLHKFIRR